MIRNCASNYRDILASAREQPQLSSGRHVQVSHPHALQQLAFKSVPVVIFVVSDIDFLLFSYHSALDALSTGLTQAVRKHYSLPGVLR